MNQSIQIKAPATVANIVCGFDVLGMAINDPYDEMTIKISDKPGIRIKHTDHFGLPEETGKNVAGVALMAMLQQLDRPPGIEVTIHKNIMPGSGLGSSAASSAGVVAAVNHLLGNPFTNLQLLHFAAEGERFASGTAHFDNVTPCLLGGITLINSFNGLTATPISFPPLWCSIIHPQIEVKTADSRRIIKKEVALQSAIHQWANIAGLITGFFKHDYDLISQSLEDVIFEPSRSILIPGFADVKKKSRKAGALGGGISGSGPSIFMFSKNEQTATLVEKEMKEVYEKIGLPYKTYVTTIKPFPLI